MTKFVHDKDQDCTDVLMDDDVNIQDLNETDVPFSKQELVPSQLNLSLITKVSVNQLISLKAKVINLQEPKKAGSSSLRKAEAILVDEYGSVKVLFWEEDIEKVEDEQTYHLKDLRVKKDKYSGEVYVNPAKGLSVLTKCEAFKGNLAMQQTIPDEFLKSQVTSDILGIADIKNELCCLKCNRRMKPAGKIGHCTNPKCNLKQKLSACRQQWYLKALLKDTDNNNVYVIFRHDMIMHALSLNGTSVDLHDLSEDSIQEAFLEFPVMEVTYESKSKVVNSVFSTPQ